MIMRSSARSPWLPMVAAFVWLSPAASAVTIDWVTIGDPGNACDPQMSGCHGSVADVYRIGKHEVTNAQYAEFLSAKAASDPLGMYNTDMGTTIWGGIERSGSSGSHTYSLVAGREQMPVTGRPSHGIEIIGCSAREDATYVATATMAAVSDPDQLREDRIESGGYGELEPFKQLDTHRAVEFSGDQTSDVEVELDRLFHIDELEHLSRFDGPASQRFVEMESRARQRAEELVLDGKNAIAVENEVEILGHPRFAVHDRRDAARQVKPDPKAVEHGGHLRESGLETFSRDHGRPGRRSASWRPDPSRTGGARPPV